MFNPKDVFPPPNVGNATMPWARRLTDAVRDVGRAVAQQSLLINGNNRALSGQMGVLSRQLERLQSNVTELQSRTTTQVTPDDLTVSGSSAAPHSATRLFSFAAPQGGSRAAILTFSCTYTASDVVESNVFPELYFGANRIWGGSSTAVPQLMSAPAGWTNSTSAVVAVNIPAGISPTFTFILNRVTFSAATTSVTAINMNAVLTYGDKY